MKNIWWNTISSIFQKSGNVGYKSKFSFINKMTNGQETRWDKESLSLSNDNWLITLQTLNTWVRYHDKFANVFVHNSVRYVG